MLTAYRRTLRDFAAPRLIPHKDGGLDGMQSFDGEIERLVGESVLTVPTAMCYATNPGHLAVQLADVDVDADSIASLIER